jgi:ubiquinone/menaquinone biosynthesis C-methylase UbiE
VNHREGGGSPGGPTDPRERFSGAAGGYARSRPGYPGPLLDWVIAQAGVRPGDAVLDLGCGTGILTRLLAERGLKVVGVDPNQDMLDQARQASPESEIDYRRGDAETTGLRDGSVSLVTVAQAFHWFDLDSALGEIHRVVRPGGRAAALWNIRGEGPFMGAYDALLRRFSSEYEVLESWESTLERLKRHTRVRDARERWETHAQRFDLEGLRGRAWSSSYVFRGVEDRDGFDAALAELHTVHARHGLVEFPYRTVALVFGVADDSAR